MAADKPLRVLVLTREPDLARRLAEPLRELASDVWLSADDVPLGEAPSAAPHQLVVEVIISDLPGEELSARVAAIGDGAGLVCLGCSSAASSADAVLAPDCSPAELRLACTLVARIAGLRRQLERLTDSQSAAARLAQTDPLTGLANRRAWDEGLARALARQQQSNQPLWLAIIDLDHFKALNDRGGMAAGDAALRGVATAMAEQLRRYDLLARIGGDEFALLLTDVDEVQVRGVLERLRAAVASTSTPITASLGYAAISSTDAATCFAAAERAMRRAKRAGGNCVMPADEPPVQ